MNISQLTVELDSYAQDPGLLAEFNLADRANALALIALLQRVAQQQRNRAELASLLYQAKALQQAIEQVNQALFQRIRGEIQTGSCRGATFANLLRQFTLPSDRGPTIRYFAPDGLDELVSGLFQLDTGPTTDQKLELGMVHYERTPARAILALVEQVTFTPDLIFYDLGCGFGEIPMLIHLLTGVWVKGIEIEASFCRAAQAQVAALGLDGVTIINADARSVEYSDGNIFYMFTPFYGAVLQNVLASLYKQATERPIMLCTYGPCTPVVAQQPWLFPIWGSGNHEFELALFTSNVTSNCPNLINY